MAKRITATGPNGKEFHFRYDDTQPLDKATSFAGDSTEFYDNFTWAKPMLERGELDEVLQRLVDEDYSVQVEEE